MIRYLVFDVESIGLHGEGFAVGAVLLDLQAGIVSEFYAACPLLNVLPPHDPDDFEWVRNNVDLPRVTHNSPQEVRAAFWRAWLEVSEDVKPGELYVAADVPWPVEATFLSMCVHDDWPDAKWKGPYPLIDIASVRLAAGFDPLAIEPRLPDEEPAHNPLADAKQSARLLKQALERIDDWRGQ